MNGSLPPEDWMNVAGRFWTVANELIHHADAGRLVEAPGSSFNDRRMVREYIAAVRRLVDEVSFTPEPPGHDGDDTARGAA